MKPNRFLSLAAVGLFLTGLTACGYTTKIVLPTGIHTIYIETFRNKIPLGRLYAYEPGLEIKITNSVIRRLEVDGNLKVLPREKADAVLEGDLIGFDQEGLRFSGLERIEEFRLYVVVALRLRNLKTGQILWEEPDFSGDTSYFVQGGRAISRSQAADKAIERLARNVVDRIVEDW